MSKGCQTKGMEKLGMEGHRRKDFAFVLELEGARKMQRMAGMANIWAAVAI